MEHIPYLRDFDTYRKAPMSKSSVALYDNQWELIRQFADDQGYPSTSAALRRIINEWAKLKATDWAQAVTSTKPHTEMAR